MPGSYPVAGRSETMVSRKVSVLFYEARDDGVASRDEVVDQVAQALSSGGHKVSLLGINSDISELMKKLEEQKPDIVFNLCETFGGKDSSEMHVTAILELLGVRFTGTGPAGMILRQDKALTKKLLQFYDVNCSNYAVLDNKHLEFSGRMRFPLFIKPLHGDASLCVDDSSMVETYPRLIERAALIQNEFNDAALVEEYIDGRELYVTVLGNASPEALPIIEVDFTKLPAGHPRIYGHEAKFESGTVQYDGTHTVVGTDLSPEVRARVARAAKEAVHALQVSDYSRVDIRLPPEGTPYVVEVNANPYLEAISETALAAKAAGMDYNTLINRILEIAWERCEAEAPLKKARGSTRKAMRLKGKIIPSWTKAHPVC
jgi:D-alanine-D-alanine ligase